MSLTSLDLNCERECRRCVAGVVGSGDWCSHDSGYATITDARGYPRGVYVSARRDGSVWLRFGRDHASLDWTFVDERRARLQTVILHDDDLALLRVCFLDLHNMFVHV